MKVVHKTLKVESNSSRVEVLSQSELQRRILDAKKGPFISGEKLMDKMKKWIKRTEK